MSHGSAWMPRVAPARVLNDMLFCTGPKSGSPRSTILRRCQFSLNQPRLSPRTSRLITSNPGIDVSSTLECLPRSGHGHWPWTAYLASVSAFCGRHQAWLARYHWMVSARPDRKSENAGAQPSSVRSFVESIA